jgi:hypothetical protein
MITPIFVGIAFGVACPASFFAGIALVIWCEEGRKRRREREYQQAIFDANNVIRNLESEVKAMREFIAKEQDQ